MTSACLEPFLSFSRLSLSLLSFSFLSLASFFSLGLANGLDAEGIELEELAREWTGGGAAPEPEGVSAAELVRRGPVGTDREADWWVCLRGERWTDKRRSAQLAKEGS